MSEGLKDDLKALMRHAVTTLEEADEVAEAARLLRDILRIEEQAEAFVARSVGSLAKESVGPAGLVRDKGLRYEALSSREAAASYEAPSLHEAARRALEAAGEPLHVRDLGARIKAAGWRHPRARDPRPDQIEFQLAARLPRYPRLFRKVAPNTFGLSSWADRKVSQSKPRMEPTPGHGPTLARAIGEEPDRVFREEPRWRSS